MGFDRRHLQSLVGTTVPDLIGEDVRLAFVGINPGLWTAATGTHFAHPGNRFYPALYLAGITSFLLEASDGLSADDAAALTGRGIGITNLVGRATARASDLHRDELRDGGMALEQRLTTWRPSVVAVVGLSAYREAFSRPKAVAGEQDVTLAGARLWVLPNPSGLNAHETVGSLARWYRQPAQAAGIELDPPRW